MNDKLKNFPITVFAIVMGLAGFTIALNKFYHLDWLPKIFYEIMLFVVLTLFLLFLVVYLIKLVYYPEEVSNDFKHRIRINFFSTISISLLLLSVAFYTYYPMLAIILWWMGLILHTYFTFKTITFWIQHNFEMKHFNPAWFIPVVGNIIIPVVGVDLLPTTISFFYFSVGFIFWIILFTIFIYRAVFHDQLAQKFIPTFFILLAPPAVGFISYMRIAASWDAFSVFLLLVSYAIAVLLLFLYKSFTQLKFFLSWWAFTFPLTALTIASVVAFQVTTQVFYQYLSWLFLVVSIIAISIVSYQTFRHALKGEICVQEE
ncbi:MAG: SLAC1 anion channel family protein [Ignavibacteriaceae bacterium]